MAALPLAYGLVIFGLGTEPVRRKLAIYNEIEILAKRIVIEGIISIQSGDNPRIIEHKLSVFLEPKQRPSGEKPAEPAAPLPSVARPAVDEAFMAEVRQYGVEHEAQVVGAVRQAVARSDAEPEEKVRVEELLEQVTRKELPAMTLLARLSHELNTEVSKALAKPPPPPPSLVQPAAESGASTFEDLAQLTDREIQLLLREVDQRDLVMALKGSSSELRDKILGNMSQRVRTFLLQEMSFMGSLQAGEVFAVQSRIVAQVLQLGQRGQVRLPTTSGPFPE